MDDATKKTAAPSADDGSKKRRPPKRSKCGCLLFFVTVFRCLCSRGLRSFVTGVVFRSPSSGRALRA